LRLLKDQYHTLKPNFSLVSDENILLLAWKKTQQYVRTKNSYVDLLSLDYTCANIKELISTWSSELKNHSHSNKSLSIIPIPKPNSNPKSWGGDLKPTTSIDIRGLADISIKEQTLLTSYMMCLADSIETRQKDPDLARNVLEQRESDIFSYGNRLVCDWNGLIGRFRWGSNEYYRKYFVDHKNFLSRPVEVAKIIKSHVSPLDNVYIISLDIENFYNDIDPDILVAKLKNIFLSHQKLLNIKYDEESQHKSDVSFWSKLRASLSWDWSDKSLAIINQLDITEGTGLPQGLASAGVFANAYLIDFDESVSKNIKNNTFDDLKIHDYCRYVDDLRVVVSSSIDKKILKAKIHSIILELLKEQSQNTLNLNEKKTKIFNLNQLDSSSNIKSRMTEVESKIGCSAIPDRESIDLFIPTLHELINIQEDSLSELPEQLVTQSFIKPDSIKRFSAYRLKSTLEYKKLIEPDNSTLDNDIDFSAKTLLLAWYKEPSSLVLLRKAFEISPNIEFNQTIIDTIYLNIQNLSGEPKLALKVSFVSQFILSDIFRCLSDLKSKDKNDTHYEKLFDRLSLYARRVLELEREDIQPYLIKSASYMLAIYNSSVCNSVKLDSIELAPNLHGYLHQVLQLRTLANNDPQLDFLFYLASQISNKNEIFAVSFVEHINKYSKKDKLNSLEKVALEGGEFWKYVWEKLLKSNDEFVSNLKWAIPTVALETNNKEHFLSSLYGLRENPFKHETALLRLMLGLIKACEAGKFDSLPSPHEIKLTISKSRKWEDLWYWTEPLTCNFDFNGVVDPRYKSPEWLRADNNELNTISSSEKFYWLFSIIRSAASANLDYTCRKDFDFKENKNIGIVSNWHKRRVGMLHTPESIVGTYATISDWFTEIIRHGLQWPGFASTNVDDKKILQIEDFSILSEVIENRIIELNLDICRNSKMPSVRTKLHRPNLRSGKFRVVTVQQLLPRYEDFHITDVLLERPKIRIEMREHLLSICNIIEKTLSAKSETENQGKVLAQADLIVFSEVTVHKDDEDILKALAFRTNSIIFAGFVFLNEEDKLVNKARWIVPTFNDDRLSWKIRDQGKHNLTPFEIEAGIISFRPCQHIIEIHGYKDGPFAISGSVCFDATDINIASDLRNKTDMFIISAFNKDVNTFNNMASSLQWHMFQHIVLSNTGQFGGSSIQAPYKEQHKKLISHTHGVSQIAISTADVDLAAFTRKISKHPEIKAAPAGYSRNKGKK